MDTTGWPGNRGTGVYTAPPGGGSHRDTGGKFVHIAGRPYRMDRDALRQNVEFILENFLDEPFDALADTPESAVVQQARLLPNYPNPFNPQTTIPYALPQAGYVELALYDAAGRLVRTLVNEARPAGDSVVRWDGVDDGGRAVASGTYFARMRFGGERSVRSLVLVR